jgi:hypothetical protein
MVGICNSISGWHMKLQVSQRTCSGVGDRSRVEWGQSCALGYSLEHAAWFQDEGGKDNATEIGSGP